MASPKLVAISGSSGFFGTNFLNNIPKGIEVTKKLSFKKLSASEIQREIETLRQMGTETFLHLAWPASSSKIDYRNSESNFDALEKTIILKDACERSNILFIGIGSVLDKSLETKSLYQLTKYVGRKMLLSAIEEEAITWIRPYFVFDNSTWPSFIHERDSYPVLIKDDSPRDYVHLDDVVSAIIAIVLHEIKGEIDIGSGVLRRPSQLCQALGKNFIIENDREYKLEKKEFIPAKVKTQLMENWTTKATTSVFKE